LPSYWWLNSLSSACKNFLTAQAFTGIIIELIIELKTI
jgi:hypothetical protein